MKYLTTFVVCLAVCGCSPYYRTIMENRSEYEVSVFVPSRKRQAMIPGTTVHPGMARTIVWKESCATILLDQEMVLILDIAPIRKQHYEISESAEKLHLMFDGKYFHYMVAGESAMIINPIDLCRST